MLSGELDLDHVSTLPDDELISELTAVKGIGLWSAHMFLMFQLERPDILPSAISACGEARRSPTGSRSCRRPRS